MKKEWVFYIALLTVFALVSLLLDLTSGKPKWLLKQKISLGLAITALSGLLFGCDAIQEVIVPEEEEVSCYDVAASEYFSIDGALFESELQSDVLKLPFEGAITVTGNLYNIAAEDYSFKIINGSGECLQEGALVAIDGKFDSETEAISFEIDPSIGAGSFKVELRNGSETLLGSFILILEYTAPVVECYAPPVILENELSFDEQKYNAGKNEISIVKESSWPYTLEGKLEFANSSEYLFEILDNTEFVLQKGELQAKDGSFGDASEEVTLEIASEISAGSYELAVYIENGSTIYSAQLKIEEVIVECYDVAETEVPDEIK